MSLFNVQIKEILIRNVEQEAENYQEAQDLVEDRYKKGEIILDYNDFVSVSFSQNSSQKLKDSINNER